MKKAISWENIIGSAIILWIALFIDSFFYDNMEILPTLLTMTLGMIIYAALNTIDLLKAMFESQIFKAIVVIFSLLVIYGIYEDSESFIGATFSSIIFIFYLIMLSVIVQNSTKREKELISVKNAVEYGNWRERLQAYSEFTS